METIHARLKRLRMERGASLEDVAAAIGVSWQTVQQWEREHDGTAPARRRQNAVANYFGIPVSVLLTGTEVATQKTVPGPKNRSKQKPIVNTEPGPDIIGTVPLISWVQAGKWTEITDNFAPGDAEEWLPCPVKHSIRTFVLRVRGESMYNPAVRPSFHDGDLIFVDPEQQADHGSFVVVRLDNNKEATFKRLIIEGEHQYLQAINPDWPDPIIQINGDATICGVVIFKGEKL